MSTPLDVHSSSPFVRELSALPTHTEHRASFLALASSAPNAHLKTSGPVHFTASGIVVDRDRRHVALHFHKKVGAWLQFGGHIEDGESGFEEAARREVAEESGLNSLIRIGSGPFVLHPHTLNNNFAACSEHWDVQYLLHTSFSPRHSTDGLHISEESNDLAWFPLDTLPEGIIADLIPTIELIRSLE